MQIYQFLSKELSTSKQEISAYSLSAPNKYKIYAIPKRTSGKRIIAHPAKRLKEYQRKITELLELHLQVHDAAFAYRKNIGIKNNAQQHLKSKYLLKMDFLNFFNSITPDLFFTIIEKNEVLLADGDRFLLKQILFCNLSKRVGGKLILSIGAPSSPFISNAIMFFFDQILAKLCQDREIVYTRYADDITFSTNKKNALFEMPLLVKELLTEQFKGSITINENKTIFSSKMHNRHVTGVTITNDEKLSIGRQRKRYISSLIHKYTLSLLPKEDISHLQGLFAFACDIEPTFKYKMIKKYSYEIINKIVTADKVTK